MQDDIHCSLEELQTTRSSSIISTLIRIQQCGSMEGRNFSHFDTLRCLSATAVDPKKLGRPDLFLIELSRQDRDFAAISYVWGATEHEDLGNGSYRVILKSGRTRPAQVRDIVLDRVIKYIASQGISSFWIDQECINQANKRERAEAMQSMDVVYRRSRFPVGVLSVPLTRQRQVNHLQKLLTGSLAEDVGDRYGRVRLLISFSKAYEVLQTLFRIMCDPWWTRRWIFQEEYCTSTAMQLLIPMELSIKKLDIADSKVDDLVIDARLFRLQATRFCIACESIQTFRSRRSRWQCRFVLRRAKSYNMLRRYGWMINDTGRNLAMSTRILADICRRSASVQSDTLAIMANCCGYSTRLDVEQLEAAGVRSLSLALLALFIINGEILNHSLEHCVGTTIDFIKTHSFRRFSPPTCDQQLTFMKRCRLSRIHLCNEGIQTVGYIWQCRQVIQLPCMSSSECRDAGTVLARIATHLGSSSAAKLQACFEDYRKGILPQFLRTPGLEDVFDDMVGAIVQAVINGKHIFLAQLVGHQEPLAIFISETSLTLGSIIFTSFEHADDVKMEPRRRFLDKFVSLRVDRKQHVDDSLPHLEVRDWANGVWLPELSNRQSVLFPWPQSLRA